MDHNPRNAAFIAIHTLATPYASYPEARGELSGLVVPFVAMTHRWDGSIGFPGGYCEPGEDPLAAALREAYEEILFEPAPEETAKIVVADRRMATPAVMATLYSLEVPEERFCAILRRSPNAPHAFSEGWCFPARFTNKPVRSFDNLMSSALAPGVKEEAFALAAMLGWDKTWL